MAIQSVLQRSYSLDEFARLNDIALTTVRGEIRSGRLIARKIGRRTIITAEDAKAWQERLPKMQPLVRVLDGVR
jgi:Helix-turn-helix domain